MVKKAELLEDEKIPELETILDDLVYNRETSNSKLVALKAELITDESKLEKLDEEIKYKKAELSGTLSQPELATLESDIEILENLKKDLRIEELGIEKENLYQSIRNIEKNLEEKNAELKNAKQELEPLKSVRDFDTGSKHRFWELKFLPKFRMFVELWLPIFVGGAAVIVVFFFTDFKEKQTDIAKPNVPIQTDKTIFPQSTKPMPNK